MNVWAYWEGPRPPFINVCLRMIERACDSSEMRFRLVTPLEIKKLISDGTLYKRLEWIQDARLRSRCAQAAVLALYGGWWIDVDTLCYQSPRCINEENPGVSVLYLTQQAKPFAVQDNPIYVEPKHPLATLWLLRANEALAATDGGELALRGRLNPGISSLIQQECSWAKKIEYRRFFPLDLRIHPEELFLPKDPYDYIRDDTIAFGLKHSTMMRQHPKEMNLSETEWGRSPLLIHRLLADAKERLL